MNVFVLPLLNIPQTFDLALAGVIYTLTCKWNSADDGGWVLDFADSDTGASIAANVPLITGVDCLDGLEYLGINGKLVAYTDGDDFAVPTLDNLGVESNLYFLTDVADG